jgi:prepilin signal peptidase PulO-like enzyme (type II secretory pathway)
MGPQVRPLFRTVPLSELHLPIPLSLVGLALGVLVVGGIRLIGGVVARREAMGMGDVFLAASMGANLGPAGFTVAMFLAVAIGGLVAVWVLARRLRGRRDEVPFGPMLAAGSVAAILAGDWLARWYAGVLAGGNAAALWNAGIRSLVLG